MAGSEVGLTGTATATITIADKNDHAPEFTHPLVRRVSTFTQHGFRSGLRSHWCLFPIMQNTINFSTNYTDICCEKLEKSTIKRQIRGAHCHYIRQYVFGQIFSFGILLVVLVTGVENVEKMLDLKQWRPSQSLPFSAVAVCFIFYFGSILFFVFFHGVQHLHLKKIPGCFFFLLSQYLSTPKYICGGRWLRGILTLLKCSNTVPPDAAQHVSFERS